MKSIIFELTFNIFRMHFLLAIGCITTRLTIPKMGSSFACWSISTLLGPEFKHLATIQVARVLRWIHAYAKSPKTRMKAVPIMQNGTQKYYWLILVLHNFWPLHIVWKLLKMSGKSPSHNSYRAQFIHSYLHNSYRKLNLQNSYQKLKSGCYNSYHFRHQPVTIHTKSGISIHNDITYFYLT